MSKHESLQPIVEAARAGDAAAIHALLERTHADVLRFARTVCATPEDAEDAVQEVLLTISQRIGGLRAAAAFTSWAFQMVKHVCYRTFRALLRETTIINRLQDSQCIDGLSEQTALTYDVSRAIANVPLHYRQVLIMRDIQDLSAPVVAATLGISVAAVKSRLHRARQMVRATLHTWEPQ